MHAHNPVVVVWKDLAAVSASPACELLRSGERTNLLTPTRSRAEEMRNCCHQQIRLNSSDMVTCCVCVPADTVHPDTSSVGHFHPGGGEAAHCHVLHHPEDTQE